MKTTAVVTSNGNLIYQQNGLTFIFLAEKKESYPFTNYHGVSDFSQLLCVENTREIDMEEVNPLNPQYVIEKLQKQNLCVKSLAGDLIECRGNIDSNECNI